MVIALGRSNGAAGVAAYGQQTASTRSVCSVDGATRVLPATVDACGCEIFGHKQVHLTIILRGSDAFDPTYTCTRDLVIHAAAAF